MIVPIILGLAAVTGLLYTDANITPLGLAKVNPFKSNLQPKQLPPASAQQPPPFVPGVIDSPAAKAAADQAKLEAAARQAAIDLEARRKGTVPGTPPFVPGVIDDTAALAAIQALALERANKGIPTSPDPLLRPEDAAEIEALKNRMITALNTPEGDRTPEMTALLLGLASLPTVA